MNFFQHNCYVHCKVPRIKTTEGKVLLVNVPWARHGSGFALLFEAMAMHLIEREMPVNKVGELLVDRSHIVKLLNEAMDFVRKEERKGNKGLKGHRNTFLKNKDDLTVDKKEVLLDLTQRFPRLGEAYRLKEVFNELWDQPSVKEADLFLKDVLEDSETLIILST